MPTDLTDHFIAMTKGETESLALAIRDAAQLADEDGIVNSHELARCIGAEVTYVQHCFRESAHICRHNVGDGRYRVHTAEVCGPDCTEKWAPYGGGTAPKVNACLGCGIHVPPAADECDFCGMMV